MRLAIMVGLICAAMVTVAVGESLAGSLLKGVVGETITRASKITVKTTFNDDFDISTLPWVQEYQDAMEEARQLQDQAFDAQEKADKALDHAQELMTQSKVKTGRFLKLRERVEVGFKPSDQTIKGVKPNTIKGAYRMYAIAYKNVNPYVSEGIEFMIPVSEYVVEKSFNGIATALDFVTPHAKAAAETGSEKAQQGISWIRNKTGL